MVLWFFMKYFVILLWCIWSRNIYLITHFVRVSTYDFFVYCTNYLSLFWTFSFFTYVCCQPCCYIKRKFLRRLFFLLVNLVSVKALQSLLSPFFHIHAPSGRKPCPDLNLDFLENCRPTSLSVYKILILLKV